MGRTSTSFAARTIRFAGFLAIALATAAGAREIAVSGSVVDEDGHAVAGVEVALVPVPTTYESLRQGSAPHRRAEPVAVARTDALGAFGLIAPEAAFWRLEIDDPRFAPACVESRQFVIRPWQPPVIRLLRAQRVDGVVVDAEGRPVAFARLDLQPLLSRIWSRHEQGRSRRCFRRTWTDADGRFVAVMGRRERALAGPIAATGFLSKEIDRLSPASPRVELIAGRIHRLQLAAPAGIDLSGAWVRSTHGTEQALRPDGTALVTLPAGGEVLLDVVAASGWHARATIDAAAPPDVVPLRPLASIRGQVLVVDQPIEGAVVMFRQYRRDDWTRTGSDGVFELFDSLGRERFGVFAYVDGTAAPFHDLALGPGGERLYTLHFNSWHDPDGEFVPRDRLIPADDRDVP